MNDRLFNASTVTHIEVTINGRLKAIVQYRKYRIFGRSTKYLDQNILLYSYAIIAGHMHKGSEKKCDNIASVLQEISSKLFVANGNMKPLISHISKTKQNAIKFFSGMFLVLFLAK